MKIVPVFSLECDDISSLYRGTLLLDCYVLGFSIVFVITQGFHLSRISSIHFTLTFAGQKNIVYISRTRSIKVSPHAKRYSSAIACDLSECTGTSRQEPGNECYDECYVCYHPWCNALRMARVIFNGQTNIEVWRIGEHFYTEKGLWNDWKEPNLDL